jgi:tetratricopeptide (TPR) repeat protein
LAINKRKILASAQKHLQKGALDKALRDFQTVLEADPRDANVRLKVGDLLLRQGQRQQAFDAYLKVADLFMRQGFDAKAVALYKQITKIDPTRYDVYVPLADLYQRLGLISEAMSALQTAADHYHREGRKSEALDLLRRMASLDPTNTTSRLKIAELLRQAGREEEALSEYEETVAELERQGDWEAQATVLERILELEPKRIETLTVLTNLLLDRGQSERAATFAKRLTDAEPNTPENYELLATVYRSLGSEDATTDTYRQLAEVHRARGEEDKAREILQRFVPAEPLDLGRDAGMEDASLGLELEEAVDTSPSLETDETLLEELAPGEEARFLEESGDEFEFGTAEQPAPEEARDASPEQVLAEAAVYLRYGKHDRAISSLHAILASEPDHPLALERLVEAYGVAGTPERAVEVLLAAAEQARGRGDVDRVAQLQAQLEGFDPQAAQALGPTAELALEPEAEPILELPAEQVLEPQAEQELEPPSEHELEPQAEQELEPPPEQDLEPQAAPAPLAPEDTGQVSDLAPELPDTGEIEIDVDTQGLEEPPPELDAKVETATPAPSSSSGTTPEQLIEELEEAAFYFEQGMLEEAEAVCRRVLAASPGHPQALLRLGEIAAAQGKEPEDSVRRSSEGATPAQARVDVEAILPTEAGAQEQEDEVTPSHAPETLPSIDEVATRAGGRGRAAGRRSSSEGEALGQASFDLAAELSDALSDAPLAQESSGVATDEDGFQEIFRDFKRGVSQTLGDADRETRYDLGIAYREMGLLEDAVGEFQLTLELPDRRLDALHMLGLCHLDLGRPNDAAANLEQALATESIPEERQAALRFDLARAYETFGDHTRALQTFRQVAEMDPEFQDVADRIAALETDEQGEAPLSESEPKAEEYESFDDLIADAQDEDAQAQRYESFEDLIEEVDEAEDPPQQKPAGRRRKISFV